MIENAAVIDASEVLASAVLDLDGLDSLLGELAAGGRSVIGPTVRDGAIVLDAIDGVADLPAGWTDEQDAGRYRLHRRDDGALFAWAVGAHSWRQFLFPPRSRLWRAEQVGSPAARDPAGGGSGPGDSGGGGSGRGDAAGGGSDGTPVDFRFVAGGEPAESYAFVGVRSCDLHAIEVHDRVFLGGAHPDPIYAERRHDVVVVAVHCSDPAGTCFCTSMGTGPRAPGGYDLALTELVGLDRHELLADAATERGVELLGRIPTRPATDADRAASTAVTETAIGRIGRRVDTDGIHELLATTLEHPQWDDVAERCLACTNCTLVCPTCFCSTVTDVTDLAGGTAERWRQWDSCFTLDHSYLHGGSVRSTHRDRYRQWLTHKLGTWIDQFGSSGCVGCGRCIAWCPVGIDITAEVAALRTRQAAEPADGGAASSGGGPDADR